MRQRERSDLLYLLILTLLGLLYRFDFLIATKFSIDADEAIVGLMARHISQGSAWPVFYYGQHYMGSFEALLVAALMSALGSSAFVLKAVPLVFSLVLIWTVYGCGRELGSKFAGRSAALLIAIPPIALLEWGTKARGGFIEVVVLGALAVLLTQRWLKHYLPERSGLLVIGTVLGFGWWTNNQIIYFMLPIAVVVLGRLLNHPRQRGRYSVTCGLSMMLGFLLGSFPYWLYNLHNEFASLGILEAAKGGSVSDHARGIFSVALPILFGAKRFWQESDVFPYSTLLAWVLYGFIFLIVLAGRRRELLDLVRLRIDVRQQVAIFPLIIICAVCVFSLSSFGWLYRAPRYLLPLYVPLSVLAGYAADRLQKLSRVGAAVIMVPLLALSLTSYSLGGRAIPGEPFIPGTKQRVSRDHSELNQWLLTRGYRWIEANYWIGYRVAFETGERVRFVLIDDPKQVRIPAYQREGKRFSGDMPRVLVPEQGQLFGQALRVMGYQWEQSRLSGYDVFYNVRPVKEALHRIPAEGLTVEASHSAQNGGAALDGDLRTRWGSAAPQSGGMTFSIRLPEPRRLQGLRYNLGGWTHDYPRLLRVELELADGSRRELLDPVNYPAVRYFVESAGDFAFYFDALEVQRVTLYQLGADPVFDWSIAELELLE